MLFYSCRYDTQFADKATLKLNRKPQLSEIICTKIDTVLDRAGEAYRAGQLRRSLEIAKEA